MSEPKELSEKEQDLLETFQEEFKRLGNRQIHIQLDIHTSLAIVGTLQLALRHPGNKGLAGEIALEFIEGIIQGMIDGGYHAMAALAQKGFDPAFDKERKP